MLPISVCETGHFTPDVPHAEASVGAYLQWATDAEPFLDAEFSETAGLSRENGGDNYQAGTSQPSQQNPVLANPPLSQGAYGRSGHSTGCDVFKTAEDQCLIGSSRTPQSSATGGLMEGSRRGYYQVQDPPPSCSRLFFQRRCYRASRRAHKAFARLLSLGRASERQS